MTGGNAAIAFVAAVAGGALSFAVMSYLNRQEEQQRFLHDLTVYRKSVEYQAESDAIKAEAILGEARTYLRLGEHDPARTKLREAFILGQATTRRDALLSLIRLEATPERDPEKATTLIELNADLLGPQTDTLMGSALFALAAKKFKAEDYSGALDNWRSAREKCEDSDKRAAAYNIALCHLNLNQVSEAQQELEKLKKEYPDDPSLAKLDGLLSEKKTREGGAKQSSPR